MAGQSPSIVPAGPLFRGTDELEGGIHLGLYWDAKRGAGGHESDAAAIAAFLDVMRRDRPGLRLSSLVVPGEGAVPQAVDRWLRQHTAHLELLETPPSPRARLATQTARLRESVDRLAHHLAQFGQAVTRCVSWPLQRLWQRERRLWQERLPHWPTGLLLVSKTISCLLLLALLPVTLAAWWVGEFCTQIVFGCVLAGVRFPLRLARAIFGPPPTPADPAQLLAGLECDLWLDLSPAAEFPARLPHVVLVRPARERDAALPPITGMDPEVGAWYARVDRALGIVALESPLANDVLACLPVRQFPVQILPADAPPAPAAEPADAAPPSVVRWRYRLGARYALCPADLLARKNHANLFHALRSLHQTEEEAPLELVCVGHGKPSDALLHLATELGIRPCVHWFESLPAGDLRALARGAAAVVLPSTHEPTLRPVLEALELGGALTCADLPVTRAVFRDHPESALFFNPANPASIALAIRRTSVRRRSYQLAQGPVAAAAAAAAAEGLTDAFFELCEGITRSERYATSRAA